MFFSSRIINQDDATMARVMTMYKEATRDVALSSASSVFFAAGYDLTVLIVDTFERALKTEI